jgi:hypothetical protein
MRHAPSFFLDSSRPAFVDVAGLARYTSSASSSTTFINSSKPCAVIKWCQCRSQCISLDKREWEGEKGATHDDFPLESKVEVVVKPDYDPTARLKVLENHILRKAMRVSVRDSRRQGTAREVKGRTMGWTSTRLWRPDMVEWEIFDGGCSIQRSMHT